MEQLDKILFDGAEKFGIALNDAVINQFDRYTQILLEWNKVMNLTAITQPEEIVIKHYLDSLSLMHYAKIPQGSSVADIGSGAGFPGIPVKILRPDIRLTCIDALNKRIRFLTELCGKLELENVECIHARAEEAGRKPEFRQKFGIVMARAVANLSVLAEYCLPLVKTGGFFYAMKGPDGETEAKKLGNAAEKLGGKIEGIAAFQLPGTDLARTIIAIRKISDTPGRFPRQSAKIAKSPLIE